MSTLLGQIRRFLLVGLVNTGIGLSIIWSLMWLGVSAPSANIVGYITGGFISFHLNRTWTFATSTTDMLTAGRFLLSFLLSYCVNFTVLMFGLRNTEISPYMLQIAAAGAYSISLFLLSRYFVFNRHTSE